MTPLFEHEPETPSVEKLEEGATVLRGFAGNQAELQAEIQAITAAAPFRRMLTRGGFAMSVAMTNCGNLGWISDRAGYRYSPTDPDTGLPWPAMPDTFTDLARRAASQCGFADYRPEACLINCYAPGSKMGLHVDRDEKDAWAPIVSVSLGLPATFLWGGRRRGEPVRRVRLESGDVVVWGGPARLVYHGVAPLKDGLHRLTGAARMNLTFRKVL